MNVCGIHKMLAVMGVLFCVSAAARADTRKEIEARLEDRYPQLLKLTEQGRIGETYQGYIEPLHEALDEGRTAELVKAENDDRRALYKLIAEEVEEGKKELTPAQVATRNARRKFQKADPDHYLKLNEGRWILKQDEDRATRIAKLKKDGKVGETAEGFLDSVSGNEGANLVGAENEARRKMYDRIAKLADVSPEKIAEAAAKEIEKHLAAGEFFQEKNGKWRQHRKG